MKKFFKFDELKKEAKRLFSSNGGFTLVELVIVIAIIGILSAAAVPRALRYVERANMASDMQAASAYESSMELLFASGDLKITSSGALASIYISNADEAPPETAASSATFSQYSDKITVKNNRVSLDIYFKNLEGLKDSKGFEITPEKFSSMFSDNVKLSNLKYYHGIVLDFEKKGVSGSGMIER